MTRLPLANRSVAGVEGPEYELNERCAVHGCSEPSERHHLWRRSFLAGDYWWVMLPDARVVGNCVGLCSTHHRKVTENTAMIAFLDDLFVYGAEEGVITKLAWQPPGVEQVQLVEHEHHVDSLGQECPTCHQKIRVKGPPEKRKNRRTWSIAVPKDEQENGALVLDELIDGARERLAEAGVSYGDEHKYKYHVLALSLGLFVQHGELILSDGNHGSG